MQTRSMKEARHWVQSYLADHPEASVDEIARVADATGDSIPKEIVSQARRDFRLAQTFPSPRPPPSAPLIGTVPVPRCDRCGKTGHWISQCEEVPVPEVIPEYVEVKEKPMVEETVAPEPVSTAPSPQPEKTKLREIGRSRTMEGTVMRRRRLNEIVDERPDLHPMQALVQLRDEFGIGLDFNYVYETVRIGREVRGLPPLRTREDPGERDFGEREKVTYAQTALSEIESREEVPLGPDEELEWMATRVSEIVRAHNLSEVNIRTENGSLVWDYEIRIRKSGKKAL